MSEFEIAIIGVAVVVGWAWLCAHVLNVISAVMNRTKKK